jgi:predicted RNA-binding protein
VTAVGYIMYVTIYGYRYARQNTLTKIWNEDRVSVTDLTIEGLP